MLVNQDCTGTWDFPGFTFLLSSLSALHPYKRAQQCIISLVFLLRWLRKTVRGETLLETISLLTKSYLNWLQHGFFSVIKATQCQYNISYLGADIMGWTWSFIAIISCLYWYDWWIYMQNSKSWTKISMTERRGDIHELVNLKTHSEQQSFHRMHISYMYFWQSGKKSFHVVSDTVNHYLTWKRCKDWETETFWNSNI